MQDSLNKEQLIQSLRNIGIRSGDLLHLKISMRSIGKIEGGAKTLLEALIETIGKEGTIVSDAFVSVYPLPLSKENSKKIVDKNTVSYAGAFVNEMVKHSNMHRSRHPIQKFVAIGKGAEKLCKNHTYNKGGYNLLLEMANLNAKNLTIGKKTVGVGTTHVAIDILGFESKKPNLGVNYYNDKKQVELAKINWNGGCGNGFPKFIPIYFEEQAVIGDGKIGNANALLTDMKKTLDVEIDHLKKEPKFFFCDNPACYSCRIAWKHSDKKYLKFYYSWLKSNYSNLSFSRLFNLIRR